MGSKRKSNLRKNKTESSVADAPDSKFPCKMSVADIINLVMAILTFLSVIGVFWEVLEMKRDRDAAYRPTIVMNPLQIEFAWDADGNEKWLEPRTSQTAISHNEQGETIYSGTIPVEIIQQGGIYNYSTVNIGVGAAKEVTFEWGDKNTIELYEYLMERDAGYEGFCSVSENVSFLIGDQLVFMNKEKPSNLMYMLPEARETYRLSLPPQYTILIHTMLKSGNFDDNSPPHLFLFSTCKDVQGNTIKTTYFIVINKIGFNNNYDGSGEAIYQLVPHIVE